MTGLMDQEEVMAAKIFCYGLLTFRLSKKALFKVPHWYPSNKAVLWGTLRKVFQNGWIPRAV